MGRRIGKLWKNTRKAMDFIRKHMLNMGVSWVLRGYTLWQSNLAMEHIYTFPIKTLIYRDLHLPCSITAGLMSTFKGFEFSVSVTGWIWSGVGTCCNRWCCHQIFFTAMLLGMRVVVSMSFLRADVVAQLLPPVIVTPKEQLKEAKRQHRLQKVAANGGTQGAWCVAK